MSTAADLPRRPGRRLAPARPVQVLLAGLVGLLVVVLGGSPASAYWSSTGAGGAAGQTGTLAPPTVSVPADAVTDVPLSWTPGSGGAAPDGYYVTRRTGSTTVAVCASSPATLLAGTACQDSGVPDGSHAYVVTTVFRSWTAPSASSPTVTVVNPTRLDFSSEPGGTTAGAVLTPSVVVRLLSAAGSPVASAGIPVTLAIAANPASGSLAGTRTVSTAADGTATFGDLTVDRAGVGYTLVATSPGLTAGTSEPFTVLPPPPLGDASRYSVLGGTGVVNTLATSITGDLGTGPGTGATGFGPPAGGTVGGEVHLGDADAAEALADAATAYADLRGLVPEAGHELSGTLGGLTLGPGVYHSTAALAITGVLTLAGDADDVFVIQVDAALNTAAGDQVLLTGGAQAAHVYWVVDAAVTLGAGTRFSGTILARGAITLGLAVELVGRAFATGTVTMANDVVRFTTAPPPTLTVTAQAVTDTKDVTPAIRGTTSAPAGTTVTVTVDGQALTTTVQAGGGWSVTATTLPAGSYEVVAQVRDAAGNGTRASGSVVVEVNPAGVDLGSADSYSVVAGASLTNTGPTHASGDVGTTGQVVGFSEDMTDGTVHDQDGAAATAQTDLQAAISEAQARTPHTAFAGDLGGRTFHVGVHRSLAAVGLTGSVTLDGEGDPDAVFVLLISGALTGAAGCQVNLVNGAQATHVFWVVDGAAGTGDSCLFKGNLLTTGAITLGLHTDLEGAALSQVAVTLASNQLTGVTPGPAARFAAAAPEATPSAEPTPSAGPTPRAEAPTVEPTPSAPTPSTTPSAPTSAATPAPAADVDPDGAP